MKCDKTRAWAIRSGQPLVQGDNLQALKALLPYYAGRVKCIYIDRPTTPGTTVGLQRQVNTPEIKWLGKVVGNEAEDLSRHDKWLCMIIIRRLAFFRTITSNFVIFRKLLRSTASPGLPQKRTPLACLCRRGK